MRWLFPADRARRRRPAELVRGRVRPYAFFAPLPFLFVRRFAKETREKTLEEMRG